ncbi:hypothetical protein UK82_28765 [Frankia sp. ACN1ag]|nr:hypothetical protein UK82_28765 [Frankia sp. ACN1ag]
MLQHQPDALIRRAPDSTGRYRPMFDPAPTPIPSLVDWRDSALCRDGDPDFFVPEGPAGPTVIGGVGAGKSTLMTLLDVVRVVDPSLSAAEAMALITPARRSVPAGLPGSLPVSGEVAG